MAIILANKRTVVQMARSNMSHKLKNRLFAAKRVFVAASVGVFLANGIFGYVHCHELAKVSQTLARGVAQAHHNTQAVAVQATSHSHSAHGSHPEGMATDSLSLKHSGEADHAHLDGGECTFCMYTASLHKPFLSTQTSSPAPGVSPSAFVALVFVYTPPSYSWMPSRAPPVAA